jgi:hypothetical protein
VRRTKNPHGYFSLSKTKDVESEFDLVFFVWAFEYVVILLYEFKYSIYLVW